jgi:hypothetical protein
MKIENMADNCQSPAQAPHGGKELRDLYNQEAPFNISSETIDLYRSRLRDNVVFYDKMDGRRDWTSARGAVLVEILLHDFLLVDVSKPYPGNSYFGIEKSVLSGEPHSTYGGRAPQDDVMDTLFTLFINGGHGPEVSDGVDEPTRPAKEAFPYLAAPDDRLLSTRMSSTNGLPARTSYSTDSAFFWVSRIRLSAHASSCWPAFWASSS